MRQIENIIKGADITTKSFLPKSRYYGIGTAHLENENGESIPYLKRRFIPQTDRFSLIREYVVKEGDRLDNIANEYLGDPEQFWQLCDANSSLHPDELVEIIGAKIRVTLPVDISGNINV